jgi:hypothetical protein
MAPRDWSLSDSADESAFPVVVSSSSLDAAAATSISSKRPRNSSKKVVTFHLVYVREYDRVVGDHPEVKVGPPVALGWNYVTQSPVMVEAYDIERELNSSSHGSAAGKPDRLTSIARKNMLFEYGYTETDFRKAEQDVKIIQEQRSMTKKEGKKAVDGGATNTDDDRTKLQRVGRSFRKNFMSSLSAAAKAMATPVMIAI